MSSTAVFIVTMTNYITQFLLPDAETSIYMKTAQSKSIVLNQQDNDSPVLFAPWCRWEPFWDRLLFRSDTSDATHVAPFMDTAVRVTPTLLSF